MGNTNLKLWVVGVVLGVLVGIPSVAPATEEGQSDNKAFREHLIKTLNLRPDKARIFVKVEEKFDRSDLNRNIAELGIGTNDRATRPDNILEAEKILGTIHIAFGDNSGFGGTVSTPFHEDYVFYGPTLTALGEDGSEDVLLSEGKMMI